MLQPLIDRYRRRQKKAMLRGAGTYRHGYAFVGVGSHSLQNLYPALQQLGVPLRWIHSRTIEHAQLQTHRFPGSRATDKLEDILKDPEVQGVFVCAPASIQAETVRLALEHGKHVWAEKPVAKGVAELDQLAELASRRSLTVCMGLQRRHAPMFSLLKRRMRNPSHYVLRYLTGAYPEGDVLSELFIHPLDLAIQIFGPVHEEQVTTLSGVGGKTMLIQAKHTGGVVGQIELSTQYDWSRSEETLTLVTPKGVWRTESVARLTFEPSPPKPFGLPMEKVLGRPAVTETHFEASRFLPQIEHAPMVVHGFLDELRSFCEAVEGRTHELPQSLVNLRPVHEWMDRLRKG